jgi:hypothetical protein
MNRERERLNAASGAGSAWRKWGPYLSERQWGTVREDYSEGGTAWDYFPHDHARSRAYKWGEDGIAGYCDEKQRLCFALALWNGKDPIIKERLFGLTNSEGNHGEDVKEVYFYEDSTPTHSWMRCVYMYPQRAFPYDDLVATNRKRKREEREYELLDTGVFEGDRYFEVAVEYAKAGPEDTCVRISAVNHGPEPAHLELMPQLWFRNEWWMGVDRPSLRAVSTGAKAGYEVIGAEHHELGTMFLCCEGKPELLFTENETNSQRLWDAPNAQPYVKDGFNELVVHRVTGAVNPAKTGTKSAAWYALNVGARKTAVVRLRLTAAAPGAGAKPFADFDAVMEARRKEADEFYAEVIPASLGEDRARVVRQAMAGMLWTKQYYFFDLDLWLDEHKANPISGGKRAYRNRDWFHMVNSDVISMPDKWEYPWYAAWDLAFHTLALQMVDPAFAREQLLLMLDERYMHPNGQIPAYEWNFGDVNPPVQAWAAVFLDAMSKVRGEHDPGFLKSVFPKLALNFNWWLNRKDPEGRNLFSGGFLGLDNIGVFDRSAPLPTGGHLLQADGTAWMAFYCHCMLQMSLELTKLDAQYEMPVARFLERFLWIAGSMHSAGGTEGLWDEEDGFFYDLIVPATGPAQHLKVRSMVGLLPLMASTVFEEGTLREMPHVVELIRAFAKRHPELVANLQPLDKPGVQGRRLLSILDEAKLRRVLARMLDETQFLSPYGIRSLSREHAGNPFVFRANGQEFRVDYQPGESLTGAFGGNSNWRGPIWFPVNALLLRGLLNAHRYYGDSFKIECPTGSGKLMNLYEVSREIMRRLESIFLKDVSGRRPVNGEGARFREDPAWKDRVLFYEYFHGDTGEGLGASHQTGWTGLIGFMLDFFERDSRADVFGKARAAQRPQVVVKPTEAVNVQARV